MRVQQCAGGEDLTGGAVCCFHKGDIMKESCHQRASVFTYFTALL